jgi:PKD repeat protein
MDRVKIKYILLLILAFCSEYAQGQSCNLLCVANECGDLNASFSADGGPSFCEGETIVLINNSDPGFDYFIVDWVYGPLDTVYNYDDLSYEFNIPDEENCGSGAAVFSICFVGKKFCAEGESCQSGQIDFSIKLKPLARFDTPNPVCAETPFSLNNESCYGDTFLWEFGDGTTSDLENPDHTYMSPGTYTITLTVTNECGTDQTTENITVLGLPDASFEVDADGPPFCTPAELTFINTSNEWGNISWTIMPDDTVGQVVNWCFQDTTMSSSSDTITIEVKQADDYEVTLTQMNICEEDTETFNFSVLETPRYNIDMLDQTFCDAITLTEEDINFSITGDYTEVCWEFINGNPSSECGEAFTTTFNTSGLIIMNITSLCGDLTDTVEVTVAQTTPITVSNFPDELCQDAEPLNLMDYVMPEGGDWSGPGVVNDSILDPSSLGSGTYDYIYSLSDNPDCPNSDTVQLTIIDSLSVSLLPVEPECDELTYTLAPVLSGNISSYLWTIEEGGNITTFPGPTPPNYTFTSDGTIILTVNGDCASKSDTIDISVINTENVTFTTVVDELCQNAAPFQFVATPSGGEWTASDEAASGMDMDGLFNPAGIDPGTYTVTYSTANVAPDCPATASFDLEILESVAVSLDDDYGEPCDSLVINFFDLVDYEGIITSYTWVMEGTMPSNPNAANPGTVTIYSADSPALVSIIVEGECGSDTASLEVLIGSTEPITIEPFSAQLCQNSEPIMLMAQPSGSWSGPNISGDGYLDPALFSTPGTYEFVYTTNGLECSTEASIEIEILEGLSVDIEEIDPECEELIYTPTVTYTGIGDNITWSFPGAMPESSTEEIPQNIVFGPDTVYVSVLVEDDVCPAVSDSILVVVQENIDLFIDNVPQPVCSGSTPIDLEANADGGTWDGEGIIDNAEGIFDPGIVTPGNTYEIVYMLPFGVCTQMASIELMVVASPSVSLEGALFCEDGAPEALIATPFDSTGVFTGTGIVDSIQGIFDPTTVTPGSTYEVSYTYTDDNNCNVTGVNQVQVEALPVQSFIDSIELCLSDIPVTLPDLIGYGVDSTGGQAIWQGPGITDSIQGVFNPVQAGLMEGFHTIIISYERNDCYIENSLTIELIVAEPLQLTAPDDTVCIQEEILQLTANLDGGNWDGPGINSITGEVDLGVAGGGEHDYTYVFQPGTSCAQSDEITIYIEDPQSMVFAGNDTTLCEGPISYQLPAGIPLGIGEWFGEGVVDADAGLVDLTQLEVGTSYTYAYCFDTPGLNDCRACDSLQFTILPRPIAAFDIIGRTCIGETFCMNNQTLNGVSYEWNFGIDIIPGFEPCYSYDSPGNKTITLVATGANGCRDTTSLDVYVSSPPFVEFVLLDDEGCAPFEVEVQNNSFGDSITQIWYINGDTIQGAELDSMVLDGITDDSIFIIELEVRNLCDTIRQIDSILVHPYPIAEFGIEFDEGCSPLEVDFIDITLGNPDIRHWDMGNDTLYTYTGPTDNSIPPNQIYYASDTASITYEIVLIASNFCGVDTFSQTITVDPPEVEAFIQQDTLVGCQPFDVQLFSTSTPGSVSTWEVVWQQGDYTQGSNQQNPFFTLDSAGTYLVILYAASNCDQDSDTAFIEVLPAPEVSFEIPPYVCDGSSVSFINTSDNIGGSFWDFGDGNTSIETSPDHIYEGPDTYVVTLTANSLIDNCPASFTDSIIIEENPIAGFSVDTIRGCVPLSLQFTDESVGEAGWIWDFGDETSGSTDENPTHTYMIPGNYIASLIVTDEYGCSSDTAITNVFVNDFPTSTFSFEDRDYCEGYDTICFNNFSAGAIIYEWYILGEVYNEINPCVFAENAVTNDTIWLIATNADGCSDTSFQLLNILPSPVAEVEALPDMGCEDLLVTFVNNSVNVDIHMWDMGDGNSSTSQNPLNYYLAPDVYDVTYIARNLNGCPDDTAFVEVEVFEKPVADFSYLKLRDCGFPVEVIFENNSDGNINNSWNFGDGVFSDDTSPTHFYENAGAYPVTLIITNESGCLDTIVQTIEIFGEPQAEIVIDKPVGCEDLTVQLYNTSTQTNYVKWIVESEGTFENADSISFTLEDPGAYDVGLIAYYNEFCTDTLYWEDTIKVYHSPIADFTFEAEFNDNLLGEVQFTNLSLDADDFEWELGDGTFSFEESPFHEYDTNRFVLVLLTANNHNGGDYLCTDTISKLIDPGSIKTFFAPNAITPDTGAEGVSVFKPVGIGIKKYSLDIYSPYGTLIFHSEELDGDNPAAIWDGSYRGSIVPMGAYVWVARITYFDDTEETKKGTVTVLR